MSPQQASNAPLRTIRLDAVLEMTSISRSLVYQLQSEKKFPHSIPLSDGRVGWLEHEVQQWLAKRIEAARNTEIS